MILVFKITVECLGKELISSIEILILIEVSLIQEN